MLASPGFWVRTALSAGLPERLVLPLSLSESFGLKPSLAQSATWKRVEGELRAVDGHVQGPVGDRDAFEDLRQRIGFNDYLGAHRIHVDRRAHDDGAKVEGPSLSGRDRND